MVIRHKRRLNVSPGIVTGDTGPDHHLEAGDFLARHDGTHMHPELATSHEKAGRVETEQ